MLTVKKSKIYEAAVKVIFNAKKDIISNSLYITMLKSF